MKVTFTNSKAIDSGGDGFRVEGDELTTVAFDGCQAIRSGGTGFNVTQNSRAMMQELKLPLDSDPREVIEVLQELREADPTSYAPIIQHSSFMKRTVAHGAAAITAAATLCTLADSSTFHSIISALRTLVDHG